MKYKEAGKKAAMSSLYSTLPETLETQHAKEAAQLQSQVRANALIFLPQNLCIVMILCDSNPDQKN